MPFQVVAPDGDIVKTEELRAQLAIAVNLTTLAMLADFRAITNNWATPPEFYTVPAQQVGDMIQGAAGTDDDVFGYVARGTKPHAIDPINSSVLALDTSKFVKTTPGVIGTNFTSKGFVNTIFTRHVEHPGIQARGFEDAIAEKRNTTLKQNCDAAILRATGG